ncbi:hypothetical protein P865_04630 [Brucella abortus 82]|nr:hypothetical protein M798_08675 [Brucella melitensis ADMAS-G1]ERM04477.1 hypothetical protein P408_12770 [Brucella abortus S99]ERM87073.1 hypothetical protein P865_04630 [Brucella abortus 82]
MIETGWRRRNIRIMTDQANLAGVPRNEGTNAS